MPPKLTVPERRAGRTRGKSDPIDALAVARAALREPDLSRPRPDERLYREIKLLVDHRDDLVDQRRRTQQRLRWHLHAARSDLRRAAADARPRLAPGARRPLARRREQELQVRLARELVCRCRSLNREIAELDQELERRVAETAPALLELPGCAAVTAAKLLAEIGPVDRFKSDAQLARHSGVAPLEASSGRVQRHRLDRGGNRQLNAALYRIAITQSRYHARRPRLPRTQTRRGQEPPRSDPLPQTTTRPRRLQHTQSEPRLDIGATLAQQSAASRARRLGLPCRAGTTPGRTDTGTGPLASLLTSRSTSSLPVMLTGHWSSLPLATGALRSRLLRQRAGV